MECKEWKSEEVGLHSEHLSSDTAFPRFIWTGVFVVSEHAAGYWAASVPQKWHMPTKLRYLTTICDFLTLSPSSRQEKGSQGTANPQGCEANVVKLGICRSRMRRTPDPLRRRNRAAENSRRNSTAYVLVTRGTCTAERTAEPAVWEDGAMVRNGETVRLIVFGPGFPEVCEDAPFLCEFILGLRGL